MDNFLGFLGSQVYVVNVLITLSFVWSIAWKGLALWRAATGKQQYWFVAILLPIGTLGILEIIYLFRFAKKRLTIKELRSMIKRG